METAQELEKAISRDAERSSSLGLLHFYLSYCLSK